MKSTARELSLLQKIVSFPHAFPHELSHYLMARLLGLSAELHLNHCTIYKPKNSDWQYITVLLTPSVFSALACYCLSLALPDRMEASIFLLGMALFFQLDCLNDFKEIYSYLRYGHFDGRASGISLNKNCG